MNYKFTFNHSVDLCESREDKKISATYTYDALDNISTIKNESGVITKHVRGSWGRAAEISH